MENARKNAELNEGVLDAGKIEFHAGKAETVMPPIVTEVSSESN